MFSHCSELLEDAPMLVIVTPGAVVQVNAKTLEPCSYHDLLGLLFTTALVTILCATFYTIRDISNLNCSPLKDSIKVIFYIILQNL